MIDFIRAGGVAMLVILAVGGIAIGVAITYLLKPEERKAVFFRALSVATVFATLAGMAAGIGAVMTNVPANPEWARSPELNLIVMTGLSEALANPILGFTLLALAWLIFAFGTRRNKQS